MDASQDVNIGRNCFTGLLFIRILININASNPVPNAQFGEFVFLRAQTYRFIPDAHINRFSKPIFLHLELPGPRATVFY